MDLASALQREVRKTSIIHECILVGSRKNSTDKPICRAGIEKQVDMGEKGREARRKGLYTVLFIYLKF